MTARGTLLGRRAVGLAGELAAHAQSLRSLTERARVQAGGQEGVSLTDVTEIKRVASAAYEAATTLEAVTRLRIDVRETL